MGKSNIASFIRENLPESLTLTEDNNIISIKSPSFSDAFSYNTLMQINLDSLGSKILVDRIINYHKGQDLTFSYDSQGNLTKLTKTEPNDLMVKKFEYQSNDILGFQETTHDSLPDDVKEVEQIKYNSSGQIITRNVKEPEVTFSLENNWTDENICNQTISINGKKLPPATKDFSEISTKFKSEGIMMDYLSQSINSLYKTN